MLKFFIRGLERLDQSSGVAKEPFLGWLIFFGSDQNLQLLLIFLILILLGLFFDIFVASRAVRLFLNIDEPLFNNF